MKISTLARNGVTFAIGCLVTVVPVSLLAQSSQQLPDSPGAVVAGRLIEARLLAQQSVPPQESDQQAAPSSAHQQPATENKPKPVGTAVAETPLTTGVAASNPAGAAIAPAKQRRSRAFFIKVGAIVGAGAALGAVALLSSASPSRPPGTH